MALFKRTLITIAVFIAVLCAFSFSFAENADDSIIFNGDFSISSDSAQLPSGWDFVAYYASSDAVHYSLTNEEGENELLLENIVSNDARFVQSVSVEPDTVYLLQCDLRTEDIEGILGASLSVDNYGIDGTYCYSLPRFGTSDTETCRLYVRSAPKQNQFNIALRLGGYSMEACGKAWFSNVSVMKCDAVPNNVEVIEIEHDTGLSSSILSSVSSSRIEKENNRSKLGLCFAVFIVIAAALILLYFKVFRYRLDVAGENANSSVLLAVLFSAAVLIRLVLSLIFVGHSTDINCFMAWGNAVLNGTSVFYTSGMFADYPPGYMYILGAISALAKALGLSYGSSLYVFLFKIPAIVADVFTGYFLFRISKSKKEPVLGVVLAALYLLNPAGMFISGAWGQIDSILALGLVSTVYLILNEKEIFAGAVYGLAILLKPQALMMGPIIALFYFVRNTDKKLVKKLWISLVSVAAALAVIVLLSLPFKGDQKFGWLIDKYISTSSSYAYASVEAFNFFSIFGGNWAPVDNVFLGLSYKAYGTFFIAVSVVFSFFLYIKSYKRHKSAAYITASLMLTLIFTFGHYMHERYLFPALIFILIAYIYERDRRLLASYIFLTLSLFLNVICAMYIVDHQTERNGLYRFITCFGSVIETASACYFTFVSVSLLLKDRVVEACKNIRPNRSKEKFHADTLYSSSQKDYHYSKKEIACIVALTLIYSIVSLLNLGTLNSPQTFWESDSLGETVHVDLGSIKNVKDCYVFCNIGSPSVNNSGSLLFTSSDGDEALYDQTYDQMFRWQQIDLDFNTRYIDISLYSGRIKINEIGFHDNDGNLIEVRLINPAGTESNLFDEQKTVPDIPTYYNGMYFDELYHARTAYEHLNNLSPYENSHPPLGKLFIMLGIAVFGMSPFGWRISGALFGIAMLPVIYAFARRLLKRKKYAFVLTALFTFDFMHFTQTRIATVDVFAVFFILLMFYYMYRYISMNFFVDPFNKTITPLFLSGLFFGFGIASKWICFYAGGGLAVLFFYSLFTRFREYRYFTEHGNENEKRQVSCFKRNTCITIALCVLFFIAIPFLIYFVSYTPYFIYENSVRPEYSLSDMFRTWWRYQDFMFSYHSGLNATHPFQSAWYEWPFTIRPMWYFFKDLGDGRISTLTASGNPMVWWIGTIGAIILLVLRLCGKIKKDKALQIMFVGALANYLPWVLVSRCTFIYHFFATVPFILFSSGYLLEKLEEKNRAFYWIKYVWLTLGIIFFILLYPGISGAPVLKEIAKILKFIPGGSLMYGI